MRALIAQRARVGLFLAAILLCAFAVAAGAQEQRIALVIGNGRYLHNATLVNPPNDAADMAAALRKDGFVVTLLTDASRRDMEQAIRAFGNSLKNPDAVGLFYYSGHGAQAEGSNFLIPVDADIQAADELGYNAVDAELILAKMRTAANRLNIVVLDACRDNPFPGSSRSADKGLAVVKVKLPESVIVYATDPGSTASDGTGRNSPFTKAFLENMDVPGQDITQLMKRVTSRVQADTGGKQTPWVSTNLTKDFIFTSPSVSPSVTSVQAATTPTLNVTQSHGSIAVTTATTGTLFLDGESVGELRAGAKANLESIESGARLLEIHYADGQVERRAVTVGEGSVVNVAFAYVETVALSLYAYYDKTNTGEAAKWDALVKSFKAKYPNVTLLIQSGFGNAYHDKLRAFVLINQIPDVVYLWADNHTNYITGTGKMMDLLPYLKGHESEFVPGALAPQYGGKAVWEVPQSVTNPHVIYTNNKLLKRLGLTFPNTFDELIAQSQKIRNAGLVPIAMDDKDGWQVQSCLLGALIGRTGGNGWFDRAISGVGGSFTDPEFVDALTVISQMAKAKMLSPRIVQADYGVAAREFTNERAVYMIDGDWRVTGLNSDLKQFQYKDISLNTFPDLPASMQHGVSGATSRISAPGYGMRGDLTDAKADAAWNWIWFYSGPIGSAIRQGFGDIPAYILPPGANSKPLTQALYAFQNKTPAVYTVDAVMSSDAMMNHLQPALKELILGHKTPEQVASEFEMWVAANRKKAIN
jgi:raffinose/stachyose/melibiose transport system substrate-binding protein